MNERVNSEARAHHFAPQCWLAGFTDNAEKTGSLWVTDLKRKKQWKSSPPNAGHQRDFYRTSDPGLDPLGFEKQFSTIESNIAPLLRDLYVTPRPPTWGELQDLLFFAGLQYIRVPAFRPTMLRIAGDYHHSRLMKDLKNKDTWEKAQIQSGIPLNAPGAEYKQVLKFVRERRYTLSAENEWHLLRGFEVAVRAIIPSLKQRHWVPILSDTGSFIGSDNPVTMDGPKGEMAGFKTADVILFPINRYLLLLSTKVPIERPRVSFKLIAKQNTFTMLHATDQVYSHVSDFYWMNEEGKCQTDWQLFNIAKLSAARPPEPSYFTAL